MAQAGSAPWDERGGAYDRGAARRAERGEVESLLKHSEARCAKLQYKLDDLLRRMFNPKSEKLNPTQRLLFGLTEQPAMLPTPPRSAAGTGCSVCFR